MAPLDSAATAPDLSGPPPGADVPRLWTPGEPAVRTRRQDAADPGAGLLEDTANDGAPPTTRPDDEEAPSEGRGDASSAPYAPYDVYALFDGDGAGTGPLHALRTTPRTRAYVEAQNRAHTASRRSSAADRGSSPARGDVPRHGPGPRPAHPVRAAFERSSWPRAALDLVAARHPAVHDDPVLRRYFQYALGSAPPLDDETGEVRFGEHAQMAVAGRSFWGGYSGRDLGAHLARHLPDLRVRPADRRRGREQTLVHDGVDDALRAAVARVLADPRGPRVYASGKARRRDAAAADRRALVDRASAVPAPSPTAAFVRDRLNDRAPNLFTRHLDLGAARAFVVSDYAPRRRPGESEADHAARTVRSRAHALAQLDAVGAQPVPVYACSSRGRTDRVSPVGPSLPALPSSVRAVAAPAFEEHDLRCSYLSVVSALWAFDRLLDALHDGDYSPWTDLVRHVAPGASDADFDALKAAVKAAVYAVVFGMARAAVLGQFTRAAGALAGDGAGRRLGDHWVVRGLLACRDDQLGRIEAAGGWPGPTPTGIRARVDPARGVDAKSVLSTVAMSYEQAVMRAVLDYEAEHHDHAASVGRRPDVRVAYWVHDGCALHFTRSRDHHLGEVQRRVAERAREVSPPGRPIPAVLERKA